MLRRQSGTLSLTKSGHPAPFHPSNHHLKLIFFSSPTDCACVCGRRGRESEGEREREKRFQTGLFVYRLQALHKGVVGGGERGFRTAQIRLSRQLYVLATKNVLKNEKLTCYTHQMHSLLPAIMKSMSAVFSDIHNANDHRAPESRVYLFFSAKVGSNQVHQCLFFGLHML